MPNGWTRHGHAIPGVVQDPDYRLTVARCGGPRICSDCALDAAAALDSAMPEYLAARLDRMGRIRKLVDEGKDVPADDVEFLLKMVDRLGAFLIASSRPDVRPR